MDKPRIVYNGERRCWYVGNSGISFSTLPEAVEWAMMFEYGRYWTVPGAFIATLARGRNLG